LLTAIDLASLPCWAAASWSAAELGQELDLHPRGTYDFFDALVAMKFLDATVTDLRPDTSTPKAERFNLDRNSLDTSEGFWRC